jgi:DNA-binding PadR family transcriptional regulator
LSPQKSAIFRHFPGPLGRFLSSFSAGFFGKARIGRYFSLKSAGVAPRGCELSLVRRPVRKPHVSQMMDDRKPVNGDRAMSPEFFRMLLRIISVFDIYGDGYSMPEVIGVRGNKQSSNPLALAVLVLLFERPMHPYEIAATLRVRNKGESIKLRYGSLYTVIDGLQQEGLIEIRETVREGRRPERTIYALTAAGLARMRAWMRELLGTPVKEYPQFEAALSLLPAVPPDEAVKLLEERTRRLGAMCEELRASVELALKHVEALFLVEAEYRLSLLEAERQFIEGLVKRIKKDSDYGRTWKAFHADPARQERP